MDDRMRPYGVVQALTRPPTHGETGSPTRPGRRRASPVRIAAFTSSGLRALGERIGFPVAVIAGIPDPSDHLGRLVAEEHACWSLEEDWCFPGTGGEEIDPFVPDFEHLAFDPRWLGGRRPPAGMAVEGGSLLVTMPGGVDGERFSAGLKVGLAPWRLDAVAARPGHVLRRRASGRPVHVPPRYSRVPGSGRGSTSFVLADDVYAFRPRQLPAIVSAAVDVRERLAVAAWLTGTAR